MSLTAQLKQLKRIHKLTDGQIRKLKIAILKRRLANIKKQYLNPEYRSRIPALASQFSNILFRLTELDRIQRIACGVTIHNWQLGDD